MMTNIRRVGGSMAVVIPPAVARQLQLGIGSQLSIEVQDNALTLRPAAPSYTLAQLLSESDFSGSRDDEWLSGEAVGGELL